MTDVTGGSLCASLLQESGNQRGLNRIILNNIADQDIVSEQIPQKEKYKDGFQEIVELQELDVH